MEVVGGIRGGNFGCGSPGVLGAAGAGDCSSDAAARFLAKCVSK